MPFSRFADGAAVFDTTPVENMFLMDYMPVAPGETLKVYLYARMLALHPELGGDMAGVAKALRMDEDAVYEAIYWHTTGKADMTLLEKIIYMADYMEPNRDFDGVQTLRELAWTDLDRAMLAAFQLSVDILVARGKAVDEHSLQALEYMKQQLGIKP